MTLSDAIQREASHLGFQAVGFSRVVEPAPGRPDPVVLHLRERLLGWLARGYHGAMDWMARDPARRADPRAVLPGCRTIISVAMNYYTGHQPDESPGHGRIARYAWGRDYHDVLRDRLERLAATITALAPEACVRHYVDTGPVMEKVWAQQAGVGWIGKHSNLVSHRYGSWLLLGSLLTTLELEPDPPGTDLCGSCTLCLQACPTGAITEPYMVDARRCISYLTIELRGDGHAIPPELARKMGNRIFGCDDCLEVCPYNVNATPTEEPAFQPSPMALAPRLTELAGLSEQAFTAAFRHSPLLRPKHSGFLRNVRIALRNASSKTASPSVV
jgi:epoxyqueuosine reductase